MKKPNFRHIYPFICTGCGKRRMSMVYSRRIGEKCQICLKNNGVPGQLTINEATGPTTLEVGVSNLSNQMNKTASNFGDLKPLGVTVVGKFKKPTKKDINASKKFIDKTINQILALSVPEKDKVFYKNGKLKIGDRVKLTCNIAGMDIKNKMFTVGKVKGAAYDLTAANIKDMRNTLGGDQNSSLNKKMNEIGKKLSKNILRKYKIKKGTKLIMGVDIGKGNSKTVVIARMNRDIKIDHKFTCIPSMRHFKGKPVKSGFGS